MSDILIIEDNSDIARGLRDNLEVARLEVTIEEPLAILATFSLVTIGWIFFRASSAEILPLLGSLLALPSIVTMLIPRLSCVGHMPALMTAWSMPSRDR